jgi:HEPN domain-containing protein
MKKAELIKYWLDKSEEHIISMDNMFRSGEYTWALFVGHLAIEKILKCYYIKILSQDIPGIHNLIRLAELSSLNINEEQKLLLIAVTRFNIEARYDEYKIELKKLATKEFTEKYINEIKDFHKWLKRKF